MHQSSSFFLHAKCVSQARHAYAVADCTPQASFLVGGDDAYFFSLFQVYLLDYASTGGDKILRYMQIQAQRM